MNEGIVEAHRSGILTAATLMANGNAFDDAVARARETPSLDVGCHVVLVQGRSVLDPSRALPATVTDLVRSLMRRELPVYDEIAAQVRKLVGAGIHPSHIDTHKHTHLLPQVLDAVARISSEFRIPWIRRLVPAPVPFLQQIGQARLIRRGCRTTDYFEGFEMTGRFQAADLASLIRRLPEGATEFMCHPGFCGEELRAAHTRLKASRQVELEALTSGEVRRALEESSVTLVRYRDLR